LGALEVGNESLRGMTGYGLTRVWTQSSEGISRVVS